MARGGANEHKRAVRQHLETLREAWTETGYEYAGPADFLLREGRWYDPRPLPDWIPHGAPKACFGNSICVAIIYGMTYVEGYARDPQSMASWHHAWNLDERGCVVDTSWPGPALAYRGVPFAVERADDCTWNGDATVLDDYQRGWPLLRAPWAGEDPGIEWPPSERLDILRSQSREAYVAWVKANGV